MPASACGGGPAFTNYLCFQYNLSHVTDVVRVQTFIRALVKCSASAPWLGGGGLLLCPQKGDTRASFESVGVGCIIKNYENFH